MILVTGASGTIGSEVVRLLVDKGVAIRAMTRDPARVPSAPGVEVVHGDFDDPHTLERAAAGMKTVFLLTAPRSPSQDHDVAMIDAARAGGVTKVVKLSAIGSGERTDDGTLVGEWHLRAEQAVQASGMAWTLLRPTSFASNSLRWRDLINTGKPIPNPTAAATQGVVDPRDVAAVAAAALTATVHDGQTYTLTGPELLSVPDQAAVLARVLDRPVTTIEQTLAEARHDAREQMRAFGLAEAFVEVYLTALAWSRAGHNAVVTEDVPRILGRPATSFETWASEHREAFKGGRLATEPSSS